MRKNIFFFRIGKTSTIHCRWERWTVYCTWYKSLPDTFRVFRVTCKNKWLVWSTSMWEKCCIRTKRWYVKWLKIVFRKSSVCSWWTQKNPEQKLDVKLTQESVCSKWKSENRGNALQKSRIDYKKYHHKCFYIQSTCYGQFLADISVYLTCWKNFYGYHIYDNLYDFK